MSWCILLPLLFVFAEAEQCPPGYSFCSAANKCYRLYKDRLALMQAQYECTQGGGILATIPNEGANDFVRNLSDEPGLYTIGLSNINVYYDKSGHTNSTKWFGGTPFNCSGYLPSYVPVSDCVMIFTLDGTWWSSDCSDKKAFVCSANPIYNISNTQSILILLDGPSTIRHPLVIARLAETGLPLNPNQQVWIGIRRQGSQWYNIDGSPYTYSNFGSLYPRAVDGDNNYAVLFADRWSSNPGFVGYWQDYSCSSTQRAYICKMPATSG